jgi:two-component system, chemotaxis family, chemotaxis protein CheY
LHCAGFKFGPVEPILSDKTVLWTVRGPFSGGRIMKFLVVDDSSTMRRILINTLSKLGYSDVVEAANGREGIDRLAANQVDVIITDWNMPEMTGIEFIRSVRADEKNAKLPVLMVTTNAAKDDIVEALRAGVTNYVVKPFTPDTMKEKIEGVVAG